jgi:hypothetical protein
LQQSYFNAVIDHRERAFHGQACNRNQPRYGPGRVCGRPDWNALFPGWRGEEEVRAGRALSAG